MQFNDDWIDFRVTELLSLLHLYGVEDSQVSFRHQSGEYISLSAAYPPNQHYTLLVIDDETVLKRICERSVLIKAIYELWGYGETITDAVRVVQELPLDFLQQYYGEENSWQLHVDTYYRALTSEEKQACRANFSFLGFKGPVNLKDAAVNMGLLLDFREHQHCELPAIPPVPAYFGRLVGYGGMKEAIRKYDLKKRLYLGPTSLDTSLSFILANLGLVRKSSMAWDSFVGTASIFVALTHLGAICTG